MEEFRLEKAMTHEIHISWITKERHNFSLSHINCWKWISEGHCCTGREKWQAFWGKGAINRANGLTFSYLAPSWSRFLSETQVSLAPRRAAGWKRRTCGCEYWKKLIRIIGIGSRKCFMIYMNGDDLHKKYAARFNSKGEEWSWKSKLQQ